MLRATQPQGAEEACLWDFAWNQVAFGIQAELDCAEKELMEDAKSKAQGSSKGYQMGKGRANRSSPFIYSCNFNPYPIPMSIDIVKSVRYSWGEYCEKAGKPDLNPAITVRELTVELQPRLQRRRLLPRVQHQQQERAFLRPQPPALPRPKAVDAVDSVFTQFHTLHIRSHFVFPGLHSFAPH